MMTEYLQSKYQRVITNNHCIYAKGNIPICLVAHLDTVHPFAPRKIYTDKEGSVMWSPQGLGADDRAGVYAILSIINDGYRPSVIFTTDEETTGLGAMEASKILEVYQKNEIKAIFQLDRRGRDDCVFYECKNEDFMKYVESFGFKTNLGSFSDISFIAPACNIAAANLSIGYWNEHSLAEYLRFDCLQETIIKVKKILNSVESMPFFPYRKKHKKV